MTASAEARETALLAAQAAADKLATDVSIVDVSDRLAITDAFVLASAPSERQVQAIVDEVEERLRGHGIKPVRREGLAESRWVLLDFVDVVVHVQHAEERAYYALERLWKDCPTIPFTDSGPPGRLANGRPRGETAPRAGTAAGGRGDGRPVTGSPLPRLAVPRLVLWRHGRTEWNAAGRFQGQLDPPLDAWAARTRRPPPPARRRGASDRADRRRLQRPDRTAQTAASLTDLLGVPLRLDARLREHGMGCWEGLTRDEVAERYPEQFADWIAGRPVQGRGGEDPAAVAERGARRAGRSPAHAGRRRGHPRRHRRAAAGAPPGPGPRAPPGLRAAGQLRVERARPAGRSLAADPAQQSRLHRARTVGGTGHRAAPAAGPGDAGRGRLTPARRRPVLCRPRRQRR